MICSRQVEIDIHVMSVSACMIQKRSSFTGVYHNFLGIWVSLGIGRARLREEDENLESRLIDLKQAEIDIHNISVEG